MKYTTLLLDLDGTLFDFDAGEIEALKIALSDNGIEPTEEIMNRYIQVNKSLWEALERKETTIPEIQRTRFQVLFDDMKMNRNDGEKVSDDYRIALSNQHQLLEGVWETLTKLKKEYKLVVISNGFYTTQMKRLNDSKIIDFMDELFISGKMGVQKPAKEYFDEVFKVLDEDKKNCLVVGDSLSSDIKGANNYGLDSLWINPKHLKAKADNTPTYELVAFKDIYEILK